MVYHQNNQPPHLSGTPPSKGGDKRGKIILVKTKIFNSKKQKDFRKKLRNNMTREEIILWSYLKNSQLKGKKFRRQHGIGPYIVDFYCPKAKIVIELDGGQHTNIENEEYDRKRTEYLSNLGLTVLRFWNNDISENIEGLIDKISQKL